MDYRAIFKNHIAQTSCSSRGFEIDSASGSIITGKNGQSYIDLVAGFSVNNTGHCHPDVLNAIRQQIQKHLHVMVYGEFVQESQCRYAALLVSLLPEQLNTVYFTGSGTEAIEGAIKLAKKYTGRPGLVCFHNAYHGSTSGALSLIGKDVYKIPFRPLIPGVTIMEYNSTLNLERINDTTAAVILEPVQGEAGVIIPDKEFLEALRKRCDEVGALLVFDEVQTGFFRTGPFFSFMESEIIPDILVAGKAMGAGMPLSGFFSSKKIMNVLSEHPPFGHITTFGGHPVSCAAGYAGLDVLMRTTSKETIVEKSSLFRNKLNHPLIKEIRNKGLLMAVDLGHEENVQTIIRNAMNEGLILEGFLFNSTSFRITPSLLISEKEITDSCNIITKLLDRL